MNEMFTLLAEIGNLLNKKPMSTKENSGSCTDYLSLNLLLLGRCSTRISSGPFQNDGIRTDNPKVVR